MTREDFIAWLQQHGFYSSGDPNAYRYSGALSTHLRIVGDTALADIEYFPEEVSYMLRTQALSFAEMTALWGRYQSDPQRLVRDLGADPRIGRETLADMTDGRYLTPRKLQRARRARPQLASFLWDDETFDRKTK